MNFIKKFIKKITFSKSVSPESLKAARDSMENIINSFSLLDEKAKSIRDKYPDSCKKIHGLFEAAKKIEPSVSVRAGKFEQALLQQITKVNSLLDKIWESNDRAALDAELKLLERYVRVRTTADQEGADE